MQDNENIFLNPKDEGENIHRLWIRIESVEGHMKESIK